MHNFHIQKKKFNFHALHMRKKYSSFYSFSPYRKKQVDRGKRERCIIKKITLINLCEEERAREKKGRRRKIVCIASNFLFSFTLCTLPQCMLNNNDVINIHFLAKI